MNFINEYRDKLRTADEAVKCIKSGDWVDYVGSLGFPVVLDEALSRRRDELKSVKLHGNLVFGPIKAVESDPLQEHFVYSTWHCSGYERKLCDKGLCFFTPMIFRNLSWYYKNFIHVNVAMMTVAPMDEHGYFNLSCVVGSSKFILDNADIVILEVNEHAPKIFGGFEEAIHISEVDMVVESGLSSYPTVPFAAPKAEDITIASYILPHIVDGATVQLGIGGMPNALGEQIAMSDLKDLGMHTELCSDAYLSMYKAGKLTNRRKSLHRGKGVLGLATGSRELYDWLNENPGVMTAPLSYINDPSVIAQNDNMVSINGCVSADLYGQVCAESSGTRQISGTGGQLDFLTGAAMARGGKAFLCMTSSFTDKDGVRHSRIMPTFNGDIVTSPRSQAYYIATEYGCVNLAGKNTWERADALISIAHPDFRDELIKAAENQKIWLPNNKR